MQATVLARRCTALHWADVATVYRQHMLNGVRADDPSSVCELEKKKEPARRNTLCRHLYLLLVRLSIVKFVRPPSGGTAVNELLLSSMYPRCVFVAKVSSATEVISLSGAKSSPSAFVITSQWNCATRQHKCHKSRVQNCGDTDGVLRPSQNRTAFE